MGTFSDAPFPQKHAAKLTLPGGRHANDVRRLAVDAGGTVFAATAAGLFTVRQSFRPERPLRELPPEWTPPAEIQRVEGLEVGMHDVKEVRTDAQGRPWIACLNGVAYFDGSEWCTVLGEAIQRGLGAVMSVLPRDADVWIATSQGDVGTMDGDRLRTIDARSLPGTVFRLDPGPDGTILALGSDGFTQLSPEGTALASGLPGTQVRRAWQIGEALYLATSSGLAVWGPGQTLASEAHRRVPVSDLRDILLARDGSLWAATSRGVWRRDVEGRTAYYAGLRWLPSDAVRALVESAEGTIWAATAGGLSHLAELSTTLEEKADRFEARIHMRHWRLKGYVTSSRLGTPGDLSTSVPRPSDNDGLWTALYMAAHSYRYAVTRAEGARERARLAYEAMEWLEEVTTIPGFPTKAVVPAEEAPQVKEGAIQWYPSADSRWAWKGDCSSDEIAGHMYGYSIYYDLAAGEGERNRVRALVRRIMDHILEHDLTMVCKDGKPTRWCVWSPEKLNDDAAWWGDRGLNSLEILSHLRAAHHITGEARYLDEYFRLINTHGYAENVRRQKVDIPGHVNHSDDELAFVSYYPLLKYEDDPALRAIYLESLEHSWRIERPERNPWWNFIYGALTGRECDAAAAVRTLREIPLDLITWHVQNSHRHDVDLDSLADRFGALQSVTVLPYDELPAHKWNFNPYRVDGGDGGYSEEDGTHFLLPYWMARYYGYLA